MTVITYFCDNMLHHILDGMAENKLYLLPKLYRYSRMCFCLFFFSYNKLFSQQICVNKSVYLL